MVTQVAHEQVNEFAPGSAVIYGTHGKCEIVATETREMGGEKIRFYKLEVKKPNLSRSTKPEPAIWVPVDSARDKGLRAPMTEDEAQEVLNILASKEHYFPLDEDWHGVLPKLEATVRQEGAFGLAKVESYLYVLKKHLAAPPTEIIRYSDSIHKQLYRELSEALHLTQKALEDKTNKSMKPKLLAG